MHNGIKLILDQNTRKIFSNVTMERIPMDGPHILLTVYFQDIITLKKSSNLALNIVVNKSVIVCASDRKLSSCRIVMKKKILWYYCLVFPL